MVKTFKIIYAAVWILATAVVFVILAPWLALEGDFVETRELVCEVCFGEFLGEGDLAFTGTETGDVDVVADDADPDLASLDGDFFVALV